MAQSRRGHWWRPPCQNAYVACSAPLHAAHFTPVLGFKIQFRKEMARQPLCDMMLKEDEVAMLKEAIRQDYFFEFFFDDLPVWG